MEWILAITFVFGPLRLLTNIKNFDTQLRGILDMIYWYQLPTRASVTLDRWIWGFCLVFQAQYWLFNLNI